MRRQTRLAMICLASAMAALTVAGRSPGKILLSYEFNHSAMVDCPYDSYTVSAIATAGELISGFDGIRLTNAHQVSQLGAGDVDTPGIDDTGKFGWNDAWTAWDSHVLVPNADKLGTVGAPLEETNDGSTTGLLGLPKSFGLDAPSGFGTLASADGSDGFRLLPPLQSNRVDFLQVVNRDFSVLDVNVAFSLDASVRPPAEFRDVIVATASHSPGIQVFGNGQPIASGDDTPDLLDGTDFGTVLAGAVEQRSYTISNPGGEAGLGLQPPQITGPFTIVDEFPRIVDPGGSADFTLALDTSAGVGDHPGSISFGHNVGCGGTFDFALDAQIVPEPGTLVLCGLALVGLAGCVGRNNSVSKGGESSCVGESR